MIIQSSFITLA